MILLAVLAAGAPDMAPFMADECLLAMPDIEGRIPVKVYFYAFFFLVFGPGFLLVSKQNVNHDFYFIYHHFMWEKKENLKNHCNRYFRGAKNKST